MKNKIKLTANEEENTALPEEKMNSYWYRTSRHYSVAFRSLLYILALFIVIFPALFPRAFTFDSIHYFTQDLFSLPSLAQQDNGVLYYYYSGNENHRTAFRKGIASSTQTGVEILSSDGERQLYYSFSMSNPRGNASKEYFLSYDYGGNSFSICNNYSELFRGETEFPILYGSVSNSGYIALITTSDTTLSQVVLFNSSYQIAARYQRASATIGIAFANDNSSLAILGVDSNGTCCDVYSIGKTEPSASVSFTGFPKQVGYTTNSTLVAISEDYFVCFSTSGKVLSQEKIQGKVESVAVGKKYFAICTSNNGTIEKSTVSVYTKSGKIKYSKEYNENVSVLISKSYLWIISDQFSQSFTLKKGKSILEYKNDYPLSYDSCDDGNLYLFYPTYSVVYHPKE